MSTLYSSTFAKFSQAAKSALNNAIHSGCNTLSDVHSTLTRLANTFRARSAELTSLVSPFTGLGDLFIGLESDIHESMCNQISQDNPAYSLALAATDDLIDAIVQYGVSSRHNGYDMHDLTVTKADGAAIVFAAYRDQTYRRVYTVTQDRISAFLIAETGVTCYCENMRDFAGNKIFAQDVLQSLAADTGLLDLYTDVCTSAMSLRSLADFNGALSSFHNSKYASVQNALRDIRSAFSAGGVRGVLSYFKALYEPLDGVTTSADGALNLTDNSSLMPQEFAWGMLSIASTAIGTIATAIASVISPIIGLVVGALSTVVNLITGALSYEVDSAIYAQVNNNGTFNAFPAVYRTFSGNLTWSGSQYEEARAFAQLHLPFISECYGAIYLLGTDGTTGQLECHPDLTPRVHAICQAIGPHVSMPEYGVTDYGLNISRSYLGIFPGIQTTAAERLLDNDQSTTVLSKADDWALRATVLTNVFLHIAGLTKIKSDESEIEIRYNNVQVGVPAVGINGVLFTDAGWSNVDAAKALAEIFGFTLYAAYEYVNDGIDPYGLYSNDQWNNYYSWANIIKWLTAISKVYRVRYTRDSAPRLLFTTTMDFDSLDFQAMDPVFYSFSSELTYPVKLPKFNASTFWMWVALGVTTVAVASVGTIITSTVVKKKTAKWAASRSANIEHLWTACTNNPTKENIQAYRKAVKKNNILSSIFGGTKYSTTGFWNAVEDDVNAFSDESLLQTDINEVKVLITGE